MRLTALALVALMSAPAMAQEDMSEGMDGYMTGVMFNTSISINAPLLATDPAGKAAEEDAYRRSLYTRTVGECAALLETIAKTCVVTSVNVSTQVNSSPGTPDYLYASANISMTVELK